MIGTDPERPARSWQRRRTVALTGTALAGGSAEPAAADFLRGLPAEVLPSVMWFDPRSAVGLAVLTGIVMFSVVLAILHIRERQRWADGELALRQELDGLRDASARIELLVGSERQAILLWTGRDGAAQVEGDPSVLGGGLDPERLLAFGSWLLPPDAAQIEAAIERLRGRGEAFRTVVRSLAGGYVDAEGRAVGGRAVLRLRDVTGFRSDLLRAEREALEGRQALAALRTLLDAIDEPVWLRGQDGRLSWANRAYARAVEGSDTADVMHRSLELLDRTEREAAGASRRGGEVFRARVAAIVAGARRMLDITDAPLPQGSGGIARDVSELEAVRADLGRQMQAHVRTLDQFPTAVAMFDASQRLLFHNAAYRQLWDLDSAWLDGTPSESEILDRLRAARRLPEQADYRAWKAGILDGYRSVEARETWWHLPDRRTLRVVANPNPQGGITYLFDDVSDRIHLESRYNALSRVQSETLNTLQEGVALFGANGRLKLFNRAFQSAWRLDPELLAGEPHVDQVVEGAGRLVADPTGWGVLAGAVSGFSDTRLGFQTRMERLDGTVIDCRAEPLPDGGTLLTFVDVTASVNVERVLLERNEALELATSVRNAFVHHVSYELRSPLTTIIGFTEMLGAETVGALNERQREYAGHILRSSGSLLAIINDILDLASVDADTIELAREPVDILDSIETAARAVRDRLEEDRLVLQVDAARDIGAFTGDPKRVSQILYNLLSNAAGFSSPGGTVRIEARREAGTVVVAVSDEGRGIPPELRDRVFDRFESNTAGTGHHGVGLGLSIVRSFVELHGGRVELWSEPGRGTTVTCRFPAAGAPLRHVAAA